MTTPDNKPRRTRRSFFMKEDEQRVWIGAFQVPRRLIPKVLAMLQKRQEEQAARHTQRRSRPARKN